MSLTLREDAVGLYIHIPFCERLCHFCGFFKGSFREGEAGTFVNDLLAEIRLYGNNHGLRDRAIETIYVGGGTPTTLSADQLGGILMACRDAFRVLPDAEITVEANPAGLDEEFLRALRLAGYNRLSLGAQSFDSAELRSVGSPHTAADIDRAVRCARQAGFTNLNLDLIYGLPGQSLERLSTNLRSAIDLMPQHISLYGLTIEEGTRFAREQEAGELVLTSHDVMAEMSEMGRMMLEAAGYLQYEVSNFAQPAFACRHNLGYWTDREWLGLGPSAHSYLDGERFANAESLETYHESLLRGQAPVTERDEADDDLRLREALAFGLRLVSGVELTSLARRYGVSPLERFQSPIEQARTVGWLKINGEVLCPTATGLAFADDLAASFL
ncbi:MAG TPA: radical SAM family heme chaperone HemW [Nitrospirales bacterium]|jgi:oxygen-independent coproporphyrinogen-3 oxidase